MHSWNISGVRTSHGQTQTHKIHHVPNLGETITFPVIILFVPGHGPYTQMSFWFGTPKLKVPKFSKLKLLQLCRPITFCVDFWFMWGFKNNCRLCWVLSNNMGHITWTQVNHGDFRFLVVGSQFGSLTLDPFFGHNLFFKVSKWIMEDHFRHLRFKIFLMI